MFFFPNFGVNSSFLPLLGLTLMVMFDCGSIACFRFARKRALEFGGEDGHRAEGAGGNRGANGADQFWVGHVRRHAWCRPRECPASALS